MPHCSFLRPAFVVAVLMSFSSSSLLACTSPPAPSESPTSTSTPRISVEVPTPNPATLGDLELAPPVTTVDELRAVPIDIQFIDASVVFDMQNRRARVEATMQFLMGVDDGYPIFDLRQNIQEAILDDQPLAPEAMQHHDFGGGPDAELRVLEVMLSAGSEHTLQLMYELQTPSSPESGAALQWDDAAERLYWDFWFSDLWPARYLEMWFPANLIYDRFGLDLEIEMIGSDSEHLLITNGDARESGTNRWHVAFPNEFTSLSPMLLIVSKDLIEFREARLELPDSASELHLEIYVARSTNTSLEDTLRILERSITDNVEQIGQYTHGERFVTYIWDGDRSMEYDGATTSSLPAFEHEIFHSWYGRGIKPASQNDGWIDEAWDVYSTAQGMPPELPFDMSDPPVTLSSANAFNRVTPTESYSEGALFFSGLGAVLGSDALRVYMRDFYQEHNGERITTQQLEDFLIESSGMPELADYFKQFVYGSR